MNPSPKTEVPTSRKWNLWQRHWVSFLFLLPAPVLAVIYDERMLRERGRRIVDGLDGRHYEPHFTALTSWLGNALGVALLGGVIIFVAHSVYLRFLGRRWLWTKLLLLPVYALTVCILLFHAD